MLIYAQFKPASIFLLFKLGLVQHSAEARRTEQGLTLIESLIAIVVLSITVVSITPPIFWATASRVQTQRAEQALKLAQGEIDRVRATVERNELDSSRLSQLPQVAGSEAAVRDLANPIAAPSGAKASTQVISTKDCGNTAKDDGNAPAVAQYLQVDINGDCQADFLVQTFRSVGLDESGKPITDPAKQRLAGFVMGVRVYSIVAKSELDAGRGQTQPASLKGTSGLGNQRNRPLAVLYSTIVRSTASNNLDLYRSLCSSKDAGC